MIYQINSLKETQEIAQNLAEKYKEQGGMIALSGDLGAGKTTFVQFFAQALGIKDKIISPTFVLVRQHQIPNSPRLLFHIDLYRLENLAGIQQLGIADMLDGQNIVLIEWAEKMAALLPKDSLAININRLDDERREIIVKDPSEPEESSKAN